MAPISGPFGLQKKNIRSYLSRFSRRVKGQAFAPREKYPLFQPVIPLGALLKLLANGHRTRFKQNKSA